MIVQAYNGTGDIHGHEGYPPLHAQPAGNPYHAAALHTALVAIHTPPLSPGHWQFQQ